MENNEQSKRRLVSIFQGVNSARRLAVFTCLIIGTVAFSRASLNAAPANKAPKTPEEYRKQAMKLEGDASRGATLFADEQRLGCSKCHSTDGSGSKAGPDLASVGDVFARGELIDAVLTPSSAIAVGYSTTRVTTKADEEVTGVLKQVTGD